METYARLLREKGFSNDTFTAKRPFLSELWQADDSREMVALVNNKG